MWVVPEWHRECLLHAESARSFTLHSALLTAWSRAPWQASVWVNADIAFLIRSRQKKVISSRQTVPIRSYFECYISAGSLAPLRVV